MYKYVFGPVPSRRLGVSLGIDLVKNKKCNYNCIYCECGETANYIDKRDHYIDVEELKKELEIVLQKFKPDYITFSGSGEPTLNVDLGRIIQWIKEHYEIKTALITNSSLLHKDDVIEDILKFDLIVPTFNTVSEDIFQKINRGSKECSIEKVKEGMKKLSKSYKGNVNIEFFVIEGLNDGFEELKKYSEFIKKNIKYSKIQINTLSRPGAETGLKGAKISVLEKIKMFFIQNGLKNVEIIGDFKEIEEKIPVEQELLENMFEKRKYNLEELKKIYKK